jgi:cysteinyl-tRNA synthetase
MYPSDSKFPLRELGEFRIPEPIEKDIPEKVWEMCVNAPPLDEDQPSDEVIILVKKRATAREDKNWAESDKLRDEIAALGWSIQDSKDGYKLVKN